MVMEARVAGRWSSFDSAFSFTSRTSVNFKSHNIEPKRFDELFCKANLMTCELRVPLPKVEWLKNGKPLQNYRLGYNSILMRAKIEHDSQTGIVSLTIPQMFNDDAGEYSCKASNAHGEAVSTAQLLAKEQYDRWFAEEKTRLTRDRRQAQQGRPSSVAQKQMMKQGYSSNDQDSAGDTPWGISESETEPELASYDGRGAPGSRPIVRSPPRGLRLTEGTDAILQANIVGNPKPRIYWLFNGAPIRMSGPRIQMTYRDLTCSIFIESPFLIFINMHEKCCSRLYAYY
ncbi:unnamed protein product [Strongylus vulgaris]|uniref:Ig-like domain-containing protein n=1 Tax=Strongylus vulgaris TaxID=40348 RepID=A0A3P7LLL7_STRVU|nr:unnamed protein product [Strongylus vulgaris]